MRWPFGMGSEECSLWSQWNSPVPRWSAARSVRDSLITGRPKQGHLRPLSTRPLSWSLAWMKLPYYFLNALLYKTQFFEVYLCCDNSLLSRKKKRSLHTLSVFVINHISYSMYWGLLLHWFFELIRSLFLWSWYFPYHWPPSSTVSLSLIFHYLNHWLVIKLEAVCVPSFNHIPLSSLCKPKTWIRINEWLHMIAREKYPTIQTSADI